jgi:hypothetical protein
LVSVLLVLALLVGASYAQRGLTGALGGAPAPEAPPAGVEASDDPLGAPPVVEGTGGYTFMRTQDDGVSPVAWDPCRPVHYVVSGSAPAGAEGMLEEAVATISAATGLRFVADGPTDEVAGAASRDSYQPDRYGKRWAPLLVAWATPEDDADLGGLTAGMGGPSMMGLAGGPQVYVSGVVTLDAPQFAEGLARGDGAVMRAVLIHELGHAMGLAHHNDPAQVMFAEASFTTTELGDGDRRGLAALGRGECVPDL